MATVRTNRLRFSGVVTGACLLIALPLCLAPRGQTDRFRAGAIVVRVPITVADANDNPIVDLTLDDFELRDDGVPQAVTAFQSRDLASVFLLVDTSLSVGPIQADYWEAARCIGRGLTPWNRIRLMTFDTTIKLSPEFDNDIAEFERMATAQRGGNGTRLWDAVTMAMSEFPRGDDRRVIAVLTDGVDTASDASLTTVLDQARRDDFQVFVFNINLGSDVQGRPAPRGPDPEARRLSADTGGTLVVTNRRDISRTCGDFARWIRSGYLLGFAPQILDGRTHALTVRVRRPAAAVRYRRSYVARAPH